MTMVTAAAVALALWEDAEVIAAFAAVGLDSDLWTSPVAGPAAEVIA